MTKKVITIISVILVFLASLVTNVYYVFDGDSDTNLDASELATKGQAIYEAFQTDVETETTSE